MCNFRSLIDRRAIFQRMHWKPCWTNQQSINLTNLTYSLLHQDGRASLQDVRTRLGKRRSNSNTVSCKTFNLPRLPPEMKHLSNYSCMLCCLHRPCIRRDVTCQAQSPADVGIRWFPTGNSSGPLRPPGATGSSTWRAQPGGAVPGNRRLSRNC